MIACPISNEFNNLVEYADSIGLGDKSEHYAYMAYMMINQNLPIGEEPVIPTNEEFEAILYNLDVFNLGNFNRKPLSETVSTTVKPGVEELFNENLELANQVYEVLGFVRSDKVLSENYENYFEEIQDMNSAIFDNLENADLLYPAYTIQELDIDTLDISKKTAGYSENASDYLKNNLKSVKDQKTPILINGRGEVVEGWHRIHSLKSNNVKTIKAYVPITPQQKQQALQTYSQYLESLNKPNTNPVLQGNQQEQVKKFQELQERLSNKKFIEGAKGAWESTPALQQYGTQEEYNDYIARVSLGILKNPSSGGYNYISKVKDIVYHGGKVNKESFKRFVDKTKYEDRNPNSILGFFFSSSKNTVAGQYAEKDYDAIKDQLTGDAETDSFIRRSAPLKKGSVSEEILNIKKPYIIQAEEWENETWVDKLNILTEKDKDSNWASEYKWTVDAYEKVKNYLQSLEYDGLYVNSDKDLYNKTGIVDYITVQKVVFEPEQIHILGSKQDIEGFKEFVKDEPAVTVPQPGSKDYYEDIENAYPYYKSVKNPFLLTEESIENIKGRAIVNAFAKKLSNNTGVPIQFISSDEAIELTKDVNAWGGQPAFFFGNTIYIIPELATTKSVLHEFGHPIIRSIAINNKPLFDNLISQLNATAKSTEIYEKAKAAYPTLDPSDPIILEEALVIALTESAVDRSDSAFNKFISNLLYAIKQLLRKIFGKVKVENLKSNTTLEELGDMLVTENFDLDIESLSREDVAAFFNEIDDFVKGFTSFQDKTIENLTNQLYDKISNHLSGIINRKEYEEVKKILVDYYGKSDFEKIKNALAPYQTTEAFLNKEISELQNDLDFGKKRLIAFVESLQTMQYMVGKINNKITELNRDLDQKDNVAKVIYFNNMLKSWDEFLSVVEESGNKEQGIGNITIDNPLLILTGNIRRIISASLKNSNQLYEKGLVETFYKTLLPMKEQIDEKFQSTRTYLIRKNASKERLEQLEKDYYGLSGKELSRFLELKAKKETADTLSSAEKNEYEILNRRSLIEGAYLTEEKIKYLLQGKLGDSHATNSFLEGYMNNQDPIVFGLATYVKNNLTDAYTNAQKIGNSFLTNVKPLLERAGYDMKNPASFGRKITFRDKKGGFNDKKVYGSQEVVSFLNPWKNFRGDLDMMNQNIRIANENAIATGDYSEVFKLKQERDVFRRKYLNNEYTDAYYERYKIFNRGENDTVGQIAESRRKEALAIIQNLTDSLGKEDRNSIQDIRESLKTELEKYRQLHSDYNSAGQLKSAEEIEIAKRLREFRDASKDLYEMRLMPELFEKSLLEYEDVLEKQFKKGSPEYNFRRRLWIKNHTRTKVSEDFYVEKKKITDEINQILSKIPKDQQEEYNLSLHYERLYQMLKTYKDESNQPEGTAMSEEILAEIKRLQELIDKTKENLPKLSGLTKLENDRLFYLMEKRSAGEPLTQEEITEQDELWSKRSQFGLTVAEKKRLYKLYEELEELQESLPTDYYLDIINNLMYNVDLGAVLNKYNFNTVTLENADVILTEEFYNEFVKNNPELREWYDKNHVKKNKINALGEPYVVFERTKAWSVVRPKDPQYVEKFTFTNSNGQPETIDLPVMEFYERTVKDKYINKKVTIEEALEKGDLTLANWDSKMGWLPRLDIEDKTYVNEKYFEIKNTNKALFVALNAMIKWHFEFQKGNPNSSKLGFDVPRYFRSGYESKVDYLSGDNRKENPISQWWKRIRRLFIASPDDLDSGYNPDDQLMLLEGELYDDTTAGVPITGLSPIPPEDVSLDLTFSMMRYMISAEKQKKLIEMNPIVRALQLVVKDPENAVDKVKGISKKNMKTRSIVGMLSEKLNIGKTKKRAVREMAIDNFIEREFEGVVDKGLLGRDNEAVWVSKFVNNIMGLSAFGYFALDIPSALKNSFGARLQALIEGVGGRYFNTKEYAQGVAWSNIVSWDVSLNLYKFGPKSLNVQMTELFDVLQGRFQDTFMDHGSRSITKDAFNDLSMMTSFRKWGEMNQTFSVFGAMMHHEKNVTRTINGKTENISYIDAWESVDGQIKLKDGVDPAWGPEGEKFKSFKNKVQGVINNLNGAHSKFDYADSDRYLVFRFIMSFKRWFTRMFLNRYQFRGSIKDPRYRYDAAVQDTVMGFHVEAVRALWRGVKSRGEYLQTLAPSEKVALLKTTTDLAYGLLFSMIISMLFDFDPEDEDKYAKIRERSGPLPFFGVSENEADFKFGGWLTNHAFLLTLGLQNETSTWLPFTSIGFNNYLDMIKFESVSTRNTLDNYKKMGIALVDKAYANITGTESSTAVWDQRQGPYSWLQEDGDKALSYFFRSIGYKGNMIDSGTATINQLKVRQFRQ